MKGRSALLRALDCRTVIRVGRCRGSRGTLPGRPMQNLMVPSPSMGRTSRWHFLAGGPRGVALDAFNAGPGCRNWSHRRQRDGALAGKGFGGGTGRWCVQHGRTN